MTDEDRPVESSDSTSDGTNEKALLNRREYVALGASAIAATLGIGAGLSGAIADSNGAVETYATDFSEYQA